MLLLDEASCHTAKVSRALADELNILLVLLPKRSPHLIPMDHLWRFVKAAICANRQYRDLESHPGNRPLAGGPWSWWGRVIVLRG